MDFKDYYDILGVKKNAGLREIKIAYRQLSMRYHPDLNHNEHLSHEKFFEVQEAYRKLSYHFKKNKSQSNLQFESYYTELTTTKKVSASIKLLGDKEPFIPPAAAKDSTVFWLLLLIIIYLMVVYYKMTDYSQLYYNANSFNSVNLHTSVSSVSNTFLLIS